MPINKNVLMNVEGVDFHINDDNYRQFQSLSKFEQEVKKKTMLLQISSYITKNLNSILDDEHLRHYQSLSKSEQEEAKQKMIFGMMNSINE